LQRQTAEALEAVKRKAAIAQEKQQATRRHRSRNSDVGAVRSAPYRRSPIGICRKAAAPDVHFSTSTTTAGWISTLSTAARQTSYNPPTPLQNALYRNNRDGTFTDVTAKAGVAGGGYGMGVAVGDYNGDGFPDLYVTQCGQNILYRNNGDGTFTDVTEQAGVAAGGWSSSAVWFDYDNDGRLDLFVCQFAEFDLLHGCGKFSRGRAPLLHSQNIQPHAELALSQQRRRHIYRRKQIDRDRRAFGQGVGSRGTDVNNDGWMDLFVSNDTVPNFLFMNRGGKFEENGLAAEVAYSGRWPGTLRHGCGFGRLQSGRPGWICFVANIDEEFFSLYQNNGDETFDDVATPAGIGMSTRWMSGWGLKFLDYDNDGNLDLIAASGFPDDLFDEASSAIQWRQPLLLFHNEGKKFPNVSAAAVQCLPKGFPLAVWPSATSPTTAASSVLINNNNEAPLLLRNNVGKLNNWLGVQSGRTQVESRRDWCPR
jgi:enediyne biosynthesis protein E4